MLERERRLFEERLPQFLQGHEGRFALIKGGEVRFFVSEADAISIGLERYGAVGGFLVRQVSAEPPKVRIPALELGLL